jgi:4-hydroxy-tetrahydrodipicolinate synthase
MVTGYNYLMETPMKPVQDEGVTRREAIAVLGGVAAAALLPASGMAGAARDLGSSSKTLLWIASVTPCDKQLAFDPGAYREVLAWFKHQGADGIVVLGTTGEFPSFSTQERKQIAEAALKDKLGMNIIVNPGTANFPETLELARHAADHGADGLLVIPPFYYNQPPVEGLTRYYSMLFDQVHIPINLYHIPGTSEVAIKDELLKSLMHYPHLAGIKDSSGDPDGYLHFVETFPELNMRTGTGNNLEKALDHGMGAILSEANLFPKQCSDVFAAYRAGKDYKPALARLRAAGQVMRTTGTGSYGPMKYALSLEMGRSQMYQRPPNVDVTDEQKAAIKSALAQIKDM